MPRLFLAIDIPEADKEKLQRLQQGLTSAHWTQPDQMHITLHFLGEASLKSVIAALEGIQPPELNLQTKELGTFQPHVTLARFRMPPDSAAVAEYMQAHTPLAYDPFTAKSMILYESQLGPRGAVYTVRHQLEAR